MSDLPVESVRVAVLVPVFNHAHTLREVVQGVLSLPGESPIAQVIVVDDGSEDLPPQLTPQHPLYGLPVRLLRHEQNAGKGAAILTGARLATQLGMTHIVTIDADGQHEARDIAAFVRAVGEDPFCIWVGCRDFRGVKIPFASRFGRAFSNFWFKVHTGQQCCDVQSGFRAYPLQILRLLHMGEKRYAFEVEVLVRACWAGFEVKNIPVRVYYPRDRVSHFRLFGDNVRISLLNTRFTIRSILPLPQKRFVRDAQGQISLLRPWRSLGLLLADKATPLNLALAAGIGMGLGTLPLVGLHSILILLAAGALKVNKIAALAISQLCMPPLVPALCVELGYYLRHGRLLTEFSWQTIGHEAAQRLVEWLLGSLILAPLLALLCGGLVFVLAWRVKTKFGRLSPSASGPAKSRPGEGP